MLPGVCFFSTNYQSIFVSPSAHEWRHWYAILDDPYGRPRLRPCVFLSHMIDKDSYLIKSLWKSSLHSPSLAASCPFINTREQKSLGKFSRC